MRATYQISNLCKLDNPEMNYRKKPVVIQAMRLFEPTTPEQISNWCGATLCGIGAVGEKMWMEINTLKGVMRADYGDWIIKGVKGEFYPCKPDIFEATYELASNATPSASKPEEGAANEIKPCSNCGCFHDPAFTPCSGDEMLQETKPSPVEGSGNAFEKWWEEAFAEIAALQKQLSEEKQLSAGLDGNRIAAEKEIAVLQSQLATEKKDGERLEWLDHNRWFGTPTTHQFIRDAIDAAISQNPKT